MNSIKQKILNELSQKNFIDLEFLYSKEAFLEYDWLLKELLDCEKQKFNDLILKDFSMISFGELVDFSNFSYLFWIVDFFSWVRARDEYESLLEKYRHLYQEFLNEISFNKKYYEIFKYFESKSDLTQEQKRIISLEIKDFELNWINLAPEKQQKLKEINLELSSLSDKFENNVLKSKKEFSYFIDDFEKIKDLPESSINEAKKLSESQWKKWYLFNATPAFYTDILTYCSDRKIRKDFYSAKNTTASFWKYDNRENVLNQLKLRQEKAKILWFETFGDYTLSDKMAKSPKKVFEVLDPLFQKSTEFMQRDLDILKNYFKIDEINYWDVAYYENLYLKQNFDFDKKEFKNYFCFEDLMEYLQKTAFEFLWVDLRPTKAKTYGENIFCYEVYFRDNFIWYYFLDAFYNDNKSPWAWADILRAKHHNNWELVQNIVYNSCNFLKSNTWKTPLTIDEAETLFHEFGHAVHALLSKSKYSSLNGFFVEWDFVELPSQLNENWVWSKTWLKFSTKHIKTWNCVWDDLIEKYFKSKNFLSSYYLYIQLVYTLLDLELHSDFDCKTVWELDKKYFEIVNKWAIIKREDNFKLLNAFSHLFSWSYASLYYSYLWAEMLEADIFAKIENMWMYDKKVWENYIKHIIEPWCLIPAWELFFNFMWRNLDIQAFVKRRWII